MSRGVLARSIARPALAGVATVVALGFAVNGSLKPVVGIESRPDRSDRTRNQRLTSTQMRSTTPIAVPVRNGRAHVEFVTRDPGSRTLVIVSALSRQPGPHVFHVAVQPAPRDRTESAQTQVDRATSTTANDKQLLEDSRQTPIEPEPRKPHERSSSFASIEADKAESDASPLDPPRDRTFHMLDRDGDVASAGNYATVHAELKAVGETVQIYVDSRDNFTVDQALLKELISTFDRQLVPDAKRRLGAARDIDGDGRFTVLLSSRLEHLADGRYKIDGFVRAADFDRSLPPPFSNHTDMLYLNAKLKPGPHTQTIIAHEYMHAFAITRKQAAGPNRSDRVDEEGWLDEGLAHLAEDDFGFSRTNLDYRVSAFLSRPEAYRLVVADYYAAELFRSHGARGATYLFLRYCADRFGADLTLKLIRSPLRGVANIEAATGRPFADLYRDWTVALATGFEPTSRPTDALPASTDNPIRANPTITNHPKIKTCKSYFMKTFGEFGRSNLAGPRSTRLEPDDADRRRDDFSLESTTTRFLEIAGSRAGGVMIDVDCPPGSEPQVTVIPLPEGRADLSMTIESIADAETAEPTVKIAIGERSGVGVRLTSLSWESLAPPQVVDPLRSSTRLDHAALVTIFGSDRIEKSSELTSKRTITLNGLAERDGPIVLKLTGIDDSGRRVAAWAEIDRNRARCDDLIKIGLESKTEPKP